MYLRNLWIVLFVLLSAATLYSQTNTPPEYLWYEAENAAIAKMKAAGTEIITDIDKKPFQDAVKPVWDKYGAKYAAMVKRIEAVN